MSTLENWLAGLDPSKMNTADASGALKAFGDRVADSVDGMKAVDPGAVVERAKAMASQVADSKAVAETISSLFDSLESKHLPDVAAWLKQLAARLPAGKELVAVIEDINSRSRLLVYAVLLLGVAVLAAAASNLVVALIQALGFGARGVGKGSLAAGYQSAYMRARGNVPRGSSFSSLQSAGAQGSLGLSFGATATVVACLAGAAWYAVSKSS
ncbi:hypothetical protein PHLGIDRAFT_144166 [Phlebiopsis gigantea 11061_1 CR5-6]|uniref:Uncharacterized protein n=1 Tax=Phlebiopsis gigantea (strain 11061_1 CR5-6) TaxID=745531 RepID=A0A0C3RW21_PHLG1|nr:hypothetical protein PHLGIDRAFT_144166 [Phlebiopsis gigantea 11061_1 CR5-6]